METQGPPAEHQPPGPKFTDTEREEVLAKVSDMDRRGFTLAEIGKVIGVAPPTVAYYHKKLRERWKERAMVAQDEKRGEILAGIEWMRRELCAAWDQSKNDETEHTEEEYSSGNGGGSKTKDRTAPRLPAAEYMRLINETYKAEREMFGLDEPTKIDSRNINVVWDAFARTMANADVPDEIQTQLDKISAELRPRKKAEQEQTGTLPAAEYGLKELPPSSNGAGHNDSQ